jgi:hypothetical protein
VSGFGEHTCCLRWVCSKLVGYIGLIGTKNNCSVLFSVQIQQCKILQKSVVSFQNWGYWRDDTTFPVSLPCSVLWVKNVLVQRTVYGTFGSYFVTLRISPRDLVRCYGKEDWTWSSSSLFMLHGPKSTQLEFQQVLILWLTCCWPYLQIFRTNSALW